MRTTLLFFVFLLLLASACSGGNTEQQEEQLPVTLPLDQDSLRQLYEEKIADRKSELLPSRQIPEAGKLNPVDEGQLDTSFFLFREDLLDAIAERDIFFIMEMLDENIKSSFGDGDGIPAFIRMWELESPEKAEQSRLWEVLKKVLSEGGTFEEGRRRFIAPYVYSIWPDKYDAFKYGAVTGRGVRFREGPGLDSRIIKSISYDIVEITGQSDQSETIGGETHPWIQVKMLDAKEGYIYGKFIGRPIGLRAGFERRPNDRWKMVFLVAGD